MPHMEKCHIKKAIKVAEKIRAFKGSKKKEAGLLVSLAPIDSFFLKNMELGRVKPITRKWMLSLNFPFLKF